MAKHLHNDTIEELLRQHLLKQDGPGGPNESLLQQTAEKVFLAPAEVSPPSAKEAEMLARLKADFPPKAPAPPSDTGSAGPSGPQPGPASGGWLSGLKLPFMLASAAAILITLTVVLSQPSEGETNPTGTDKEKVVIGNKPDAKGEDVAMVTPGTNDVVGNENSADMATVVDEKNQGNPLENADFQSLDNTYTKNKTASTDASEPNESAMNSYRSPNSDSGPRPVDQPNQILDLFAQTTVPSQFKQFSATDGTLFMGNKGTLIHVPSYAFNTLTGEEVKGIVKMEVKEVYTKSDYILSNLPTNYKNKELVSGGVIMVEATANGKPLKFAPGKDLYVEYSRNGQNQEAMQLFSGEYDFNGDMKWTPMGGRENIGMVTLPLDVLDFKQFMTSGGGNKNWNNTVKKLDNKKYENTFIATREFVERLVSAGKMAFNTEILSLYMDNLQKELWEVDFMVAEKMRGDFSNWENRSGKDGYFDYFANQKLGRVNPFTDYGVNLDLPQAYHDLVKGGISPKEADRVMRLHYLRQQIAAELSAHRAGANINGTKKVDGNFNDSFWVRRRSCGFSLRSLGWTNLDQVLTTAPERTNLTAVIGGDLPLEATRTFFLYDYRATMISGKQVGADQVKFHSIPKNTKGYLVTMGYLNGQAYWGQAKVGMDVDKEVTVALEAVSKTELESRAVAMNMAGRKR